MDNISDTNVTSNENDFDDNSDFENNSDFDDSSDFDDTDDFDDEMFANLDSSTRATIPTPDFHGYRSGFVAVVGRPNVGKSTLMNALIGTQIAIASSRPETTRKAIRGIVTTDNAQMVLVDTPGIHRPRTLLGQRLNDIVDESLADVDAIAFLLPADQEIGPGAVSYTHLTLPTTERV